MSLVCDILYCICSLYCMRFWMSNKHLSKVKIKCPYFLTVIQLRGVRQSKNLAILTSDTEGQRVGYCPCIGCSITDVECTRVRHTQPKCVWDGRRPWTLFEHRASASDFQPRGWVSTSGRAYHVYGLLLVDIAVGAGYLHTVRKSLEANTSCFIFFLLERARMTSAAPVYSLAISPTMWWSREYLMEQKYILTQDGFKNQENMAPEPKFSCDCLSLPY